MTSKPVKAPITSNDVAGAIPEDFAGAVNKNAKFAPGDVAYCRAFACNARVLSVATTKSGICNYKVALYDAKGVRTGEAVCGESDLVRKATRGVKLTTIAQGASRACDTAANILEKMLQRNKVDVPLAKKVVRLTGKDFPDARVQQAAAYLNENPPALASAARVLRAEANRLRAQGKSMKAMRAAVKRAPAEALPLIAPLHSKLLMIYRKFIGSPETASLGSLPALAAQWKSVGSKLPDEEQSGVALIVRDLISAYRSFTKEQMKNTAYFLAMALGTANRMVGGSDRVPIPAHLRAVKGRNAAKSLTKHFFGYKMYTTQVNEKDSHMAKKAVKPWARKLEPQTYITPQIWGVFKQRSPRTAALVEEAVGADGVTGRQLGNVTNDLRSFGEVDVLRKFTAQIKDWNARLTDPNYGNN